jgi:DNA-binding CsgD family transcriptional regulator
VIVGRNGELAELRQFVESVESGPSALIVQGPAGIGKTTLWLAGVDMARVTGHTVLSARAAESEARFSYAALGDALAEVVDDALPTLAPPQRHALEAALLRGDVEGGLPDQRAVGLAATNLVRSLAASGPVILAIDDVQWLDASSARVLSFVIRRLSGDRVGVLVSLRLGSGAPGDPLAIDRAVANTARLAVGPMSEGSLARLIRQRTGADLPRPVVVRLHRASHGSPLFALEMARALARSGTRLDPAAPLPIPEDVEQLLSARLSTLPASAGAPLLAIAAASQPTVELAVGAAGSTRRAGDGLARAEAAGIIERAHARVRFTHPLLASTVYTRASHRERREVHLRLAELVGDPEERARHLALATDGPDAAVAQALDEAARHARARGAPDAAADLAELARQLTPPEETSALRSRSLAMAEYHFDAGDATRALTVLAGAIESSSPGPARAELLYRMSSMSWMNLVRGVREPAERALDDAGDDPELPCGIHVDLAWVAFYLGDLDEASRQAHLSAQHRADVSDPAIRADSLATLGFVEFLLGRPAEHLMAEALDLQDVMMREASWTEASVYTTPRSILGLQRMWAGRLDEARGIFEHELAEYERHGMYTVRQEVLCYLAELECRAGRWNLATDLAAEAMETVVESGQTATQSHVALFNQALPAAHLGRVDDARRWATEGVRLAEKNDDAFNGAWNRAVLGFVELSLSNFAQAHAHLSPVVRYLQRMGSAELGIIPCIPDEVEALVALGRPDDAAPLAEWLLAQGEALDRPWARAVGWRCRGQIIAAGGDLEGARLAIERALDEHRSVPQPFELGRTLLVLGQVQRRSKQKRPARESLERAREIFSELGAPLWTSRAESELARIGGRPATRFATELTATERRVADLVAEGKTNKEVAGILVVSDRTVESALTGIYRKLGVRSRTELARKVARMD